MSDPIQFATYAEKHSISIEDTNKNKIEDILSYTHRWKMSEPTKTTTKLYIIVTFFKIV